MIAASLIRRLNSHCVRRWACVGVKHRMHVGDTGRETFNSIFFSDIQSCVPVLYEISRWVHMLRHMKNRYYHWWSKFMFWRFWEVFTLVLIPEGLCMCCLRTSGHARARSVMSSDIPMHLVAYIFDFARWNFISYRDQAKYNIQLVRMRRKRPLVGDFHIEDSKE